MLQETEVTQNDIDRALQSIQQKGISSSTKPVLQVNIDRIQKAQNGGFPQDMFHATLAPRQAFNEAQEQMLMSQGYKREYIHCTHPKWMHRRNSNPKFINQDAHGNQTGNPYVESREVKSPAEEHKLVSGKKERNCGPWVTSIDLIEPLADTPGAEDMRTQLAYSEGQVNELRRAAAHEGATSTADPKPRKQAAPAGGQSVPSLEMPQESKDKLGIK